MMACVHCRRRRWQRRRMMMVLLLFLVVLAVVALSAIAATTRGKRFGGALSGLNLGVDLSLLSIGAFSPTSRADLLRG